MNLIILLIFSALISAIPVTESLAQSELDFQIMPNMESTDTQVIAGYFNIGHGHLKDGTSIYEPYLFTGFENPPLYLSFDENIIQDAQQWLEYGGQTIGVKAKVEQDQKSISRALTNSIIVDVAEIIPPQKIPREFNIIPKYKMSTSEVTTTVNRDTPNINYLVYEEDVPVKNTSHLRTDPKNPPVPSPMQTLVILSKFQDFDTVEPHAKNYFDLILFSPDDSLHAFFADA